MYEIKNVLLIEKENLRNYIKNILIELYKKVTFLNTFEMSIDCFQTQLKSNWKIYILISFFSLILDAYTIFFLLKMNKNENN